MKTIVWLLPFFLLSPFICGGTGTNGFLVFDIERYTSAAGNTHVSDIHQKYKIPVTDEFMSNFKRVPSHISAGTGFWCNGGNLNDGDGDTRFMWWIQKMDDHRWSINMWGKGFETVNGLKLNSWNPCVSQYLTIERWEDLDMKYSLSYNNQYDGLGISFQAKYVAAEDLKAEGPVPTAPVKRADQSVLFQGDDPSHFQLKINCAFKRIKAVPKILLPSGRAEADCGLLGFGLVSSPAIPESLPS